MSLYKSLFGKDHIKDGDVVEFAEHGRAGGVSTGQGFKFTASVPETILSDATTTTDVTYFGWAAPGSNTTSGKADARWKIMKLDETGDMTSTWADGNDDYDNIWDNRASLSYS